MSTTPEEMFDVRKLERYLAEGLLTREEVDAHLASLEDCAANADVSHIQMLANARGRHFVAAEDGPAEEDEG